MDCSICFIVVVIGGMLLLPGAILTGVLGPDHPDTKVGPILLGIGSLLVTLGVSVMICNSEDCGYRCRKCCEYDYKNRCYCCYVCYMLLLACLCWPCILCVYLKNGKDGQDNEVVEVPVPVTSSGMSANDNSRTRTDNESTVSVIDETGTQTRTRENGGVRNEQSAWHVGNTTVIPMTSPHSDSVNHASDDPPAYDEAWGPEANDLSRGNTGGSESAPDYGLVVASSSQPSAPPVDDEGLDTPVFQIGQHYSQAITSDSPPSYDEVCSPEKRAKFKKGSEHPHGRSTTYHDGQDISEHALPPTAPHVYEQWLNEHADL